LSQALATLTLWLGHFSLQAIGGVPASAYLLAKHVAPIRPFVFIAAYVVAAGVATFISTFFAIAFVNA
jgi:hypothetical protein